MLESLALKHAETVDLLRRVAGAEPSELYVLGGGARNDLLCQWTADASGLPVLAGPEEATLVGNLLVQAMALGEVGSIDEARAIVRRSFAPARTSRSRTRPGPRPAVASRRCRPFPGVTA